MRYRTYFRLVSAAMQNDFFDRWGFILQLIASTLQMFPSVITMILIILRFGSLAGWKLGEYMFLFIFANLSYGIRNLFFGAYRNIPNKIINGDLDSILLRPCNELVFISSKNFGNGGWSYIIVASIFFLLFFDIFEINWTLVTILLLPVAIISGALVQGAITLAISCAAFFIMDSKGIDNMYSGFREFTWYPLQIFNPIIQGVLYTIIPLAYSCFVPCGIFLRNNIYYSSHPQWLYAISLFIGPILFFISCKLWAISLKRYASSGT